MLANNKSTFLAFACLYFNQVGSLKIFKSFIDLQHRKIIFAQDVSLVRNSFVFIFLQFKKSLVEKDLAPVTNDLFSNEFSHRYHLSNDLIDKFIKHFVFESKNAITQYEDIGFDVQQDVFGLLLMLCAVFFFHE